MKAETICVGTEILLGNIVNTNAAYLASQYARYGIESYCQTVVGDNAERIKAALEAALNRSDIIVFSGGLGPTQDDITKECVASYLGLSMHVDEPSMKKIEEHFKKRGREMAENNRRQAMIPDGATILKNENGLAPGVLIETEKSGAKKVIILLPGPPEELKSVWEADAVSYLRNLSGKVIESVMVKVCGRAESEIAAILDDMINSEGPVTVAPYAGTAEVDIRLTAAAEDEKEAKKLIKPVVKEIKARLGDSVYTTHAGKSLEEAVVELLLANKLTVTTVESCTGGLLAGRIINVPGVSEIYKAGYITYSNKAKRKIAGVSRKTLDKYGAVSEQTVKEMAKGATNLYKADVAVAVSGNAGPDASEGKPVGLVYIAVNVAGKVSVKEFNFSGDRAKIRNLSVANALVMMRQCILEYYGRMTFGSSDK